MLKRWRRSFADKRTDEMMNRALITQRQDSAGLPGEPELGDELLAGYPGDDSADLVEHHTFLQEAAETGAAQPSQFTVNPDTLAAASVGMQRFAEGAPHTEEETEELVEKVKRMQNFYSHDYDPNDSDLDRKVDQDRNMHDYHIAEVWKWFLSFFIGAVMGSLAFCIDLGIETLTKQKFGFVSKYITTTALETPFSVYLGITLVFAICAGGIVNYIEPLGAGSGIPEMKTYLNGVHLKGLMSMKTIFVKLIGVVFSISCGLIAGKEGPFVHGGGIVGGGVSAMGSMTLTKMFGLKVAAPRLLGGQFRTDADHRDFAAIGTAAGVATAFNAPIGGLLFTIEEGCSFYSTSIFWRGFLATCTGVMTLHWWVKWFNDPSDIWTSRFGGHRDFGLYSDQIALYGQVFFYYIWELPIFALMGAVGGMAGAAFIHMNVELTQWRYTFVPVTKPFRRTFEVCLVAMVSATAMLVVTYNSPCADLPKSQMSDKFEGLLQTEVREDQLYGEGAPTGEEEFFPQLWCPEGKYSVFGQLLFVPLAQSLRLLIHLNEASGAFDYHLVALALHSTIVYFLMTWTYGVGAASGLFVPCMAVGASAGRLVGQALSTLLPRLGFAKVVLSLPAYSVIGAASMLGGSTRMTLSITVLVMETTGALQLIVPLMIAIFMAKQIGDQFGHGIYDTHIKLRGAPLLDEPNLEYFHRMQMDKLQVKDLMSTGLLTLPPVVRVSKVVKLLALTTHSAVPVTNERHHAQGGEDTGFKLEGMITRQMLLKLIKHRADGSSMAFSHERSTSPDSGIPATAKERQALQALLSHRPINISEAEVPHLVKHISEEELEMYLDLRPYMQRNPFVISEDASMSRAYRLFRTMGLRYLYVCTPAPRVVGLITRKDLTEEVAALKIGEMVNEGTQVDHTRILDKHREVSKRYPFMPYAPYDASDKSIARKSSELLRTQSQRLNEELDSHAPHGISKDSLLLRPGGRSDAGGPSGMLHPVPEDREDKNT